MAEQLTGPPGSGSRERRAHTRGLDEQQLVGLVHTEVDQPMHALEIKDGEVDQLRYATRRCARDVDRPRDRVDHAARCAAKALGSTCRHSSSNAGAAASASVSYHRACACPSAAWPGVCAIDATQHTQPEVERIAAERGQAVRGAAQPRARHRDQDRQHDARVGLQCSRSSAARS